MTMNEGTNPWKGIDKPLSGFNVILVDPVLPHNFYWGKDTQGNYLILLEIDDKTIDHLQNKKIELKGIKTDIRFNPNTGKYVYVLSLQLTQNVDIFLRLCNDLITCTRKVKGNRDALEVLYARLKRWKAFLSGKPRKLLTAQEVQGLFAELCFIDKYIDNNCIDPATLISGWEGPLSKPHDFILGNVAIEIKSIAGSQKNIVRISSENQLTTHLDSLYLHVYYLAEYHESSTGHSLNSLVNLIRQKITHSDLLDEFDSKLSEAGYIELHDYDSPYYSVMQEKHLEWERGSPRLHQIQFQKG